ncbi:MAG: SRPBCC family protein [Deltaproteobacteria bacterium]|nr:SRPBCC family protein [Deltaproteobacteria bacterium]
MQRISALTLLLTFIAAPALAQDDRSYEGITWRKVSEPGIEVQGGEATGVLNAPIDRVARQVRDYASYDDFLPHFRQSRVLGERGDRAMVYLQVEILHGAGTLWAQVQIHARESGDGQVIEARMLRGNMDGFIARWKLEPVGDSQTRVTFTLVADPQVPAPSSVVANQNEVFAKKSVRALRNRLR